MYSVLVTRPRSVAEEFAERLRREGFRPFLAPMMEYAEVHADYSDVASYQALVFTSAEAIRVFAAHVEKRDWPVLAVGDATAAAASKAGFKKIYSAEGDSEDVAELIRAKAGELSLKKVLHPCSEDTPSNISAAVIAIGVEIACQTVYKAVFLEKMPDDVKEALQAGEVDAVTFFSTRTAENFARLIKQNSLRGSCENMEAVCISERVAVAVRDLPWKSVLISKKQNTESVIYSLKEAEKRIPTLSVEAVIAAFGGLRPLARRLELPVSTVQGWQARGAIPKVRVEAVMKAAKEDGLNISVSSEKKEVASSGGERRRERDRRQQQPTLDVRGYIQAATYTGPDRRTMDRRAYEQRQHAAVVHEKMKFVNRTLISFSVLLTLITLIGFFLLMPEFNLLKEKIKASGTAAAPANKEGKSFSMEGALNSGIEKMQNTGLPLSNIAGEIASSAASAIGIPAIMSIRGGNIGGFVQAIGNMSSLINTPGGGGAVEKTMATLRALLANAPDDPEALNAAIKDARMNDKTLDSMMGQVGGKDMAAGALLLVLNEFRSNVSLHRPYAKDLELLKKFSGNNPEMNKSLERLAPYAEKGVMSRDALQKTFTGLASDIVMAKMAGEDISVKEQALKRFRKLEAAVSTGAVDGQDSAAVVARAQILLNQGDVKGAVRELQALDGASAEAASPWMENAAGSVMAGPSADDLTQGVLGSISGGDGSSIEEIFSAIKNSLHNPGTIYGSPSMGGGSGDYGGVLAPTK